MIFIMLCVSACGAAQKWARYINERFDYSVEYPDIFSKRIEPANGDGVWLESKDRKYYLTLSGGYNIFMQDGNSMLEARESAGTIKKDSDSTWFRLIRRDKNKIIHEYGIVNDDAWASFTFTYPESKNFNEAIRRMEKTLQFGINN